MPIEIKELVIRAVVDSKSMKQTRVVSSVNDRENTNLDYLESIVKGIKNKNER